MYTLLQPIPGLVFFCFEATYNTLASPQNQCLWGFKYDTDCAQHRNEEQSVPHILAGCQWRYTFYHNAVLKGIANEALVMITQVIKEVGKVDKDNTFIFVKQKEQHKRSSRKLIN